MESSRCAIQPKAAGVRVFCVGGARPRLAWCAILAVLALSTPALAAPLAINLTAEVKPLEPCPYGPGTTTNPHGQAVTADQRSLFLDGQPWVPIVGEFHYARYARAEWRDELLKMKAGGINTVSTYVFWIHHEEERDQWDWSGQRSLRDFLKLAQEVGLKAIVRLGPWCHGEARNGGFPDWVQNSGTHLRENDPAFLKLVEPLFNEEAKQMKGLLWKDGGPVIGVQLDNECDRADYLLALKQMARAAGIDVPLYTITGWQGGLPKEDLIPCFGGYADGFWGGSREDYRKEFLFNEVRAMNDLGAQMTINNPGNTKLIARFPYACVEIGAGMASAYGRRIALNPDTIAALALAKLGSGNNMPGYYMYQGGTNPEGKHSWLNEDHPNQLPIKDYDFDAPLGAKGQVRASYGLLREQHLFLQDFGASLARMPAFFPEQRPHDLHDFDTLRWDVRSDGTSGFLFFSNEQPYAPLPAHSDVQFALKTAAGPVLVPRQPITIPSGSYGILPVNLDCGGLVLEYATAQLLCRVNAGKAAVYFFTAIPGIEPELMFRAGSIPVTAANAEKEPAGQIHVSKIKPGTAVAARADKPDGGVIAFVVLTPEQGCQLSRGAFAGADRAMLSAAVVLTDGNDLRLQGEDPRTLAVELFPPVKAVKTVSGNLPGTPDGVFTRFDPRLRPAAELEVKVLPVKKAGPAAATMNGTAESAWNDAAIYKLDLPDWPASRRVLINVHYIGDAARLYLGDTLLDDQYYNGEPFAIALWRIPAAGWPNLRLKILPYSDGLRGRLPESAQALADQAKAAGTLDQVRATAVEQSELRVSPLP
jgi:beta-galactosidase